MMDSCTLWQFSVLNLDASTRITGVVLSKRLKWEAKVNRILHLVYMLRSYFIRPAVEKRVTIDVAGKHIDTSTDKSGRFYFDSGRLTGPFDLKVEGESISANQNEYPVVFDYWKNDFFVISDIDDTIMVSHTLNAYKRVTNLAFRHPTKRAVIPFTEALLKRLAGLNAGFFYISKSESNLYGSIMTFILENRLPAGKIFLTRHLPFYKLLHPKKDRNHKIKAINYLLDNTSDKPFVFIGDDTQRDLEIYTRIAEQYPNRVLKIYIRKTRKKPPSTLQSNMHKILQVGVPFLYFSDTDDIDREMEVFEKLSHKGEVPKHKNL